jgi:hypothetical protein
MSRSLAPLAVAFLAAVAPAADAARERAVTASYQTPGGVSGVITGETTVNGAKYGGAVLPTRKGESRAVVSVNDASGLPAAFRLSYDSNRDGAVDTTIGDFCGTTGSPVRFAPTGGELAVWVNAGTCGAGASAPTTGTVTARLS